MPREESARSVVSDGRNRHDSARNISSSQRRPTPRDDSAIGRSTRNASPSPSRSHRARRSSHDRHARHPSPENNGRGPRDGQRGVSLSPEKPPSPRHKSSRHHSNRSASPSRRRHRHRSRPRSRSRSPKRRPRQSRSPSPSRSAPHQRSRKPLPSQDESFQGRDGESEAPVSKEKPNFRPTGLLAAETNKVTYGQGRDAKSIVLKYHEPPEARKPPSGDQWTMFIFKGAAKDPLHTIQLYSKSCWLLGRETAVADIPIEHPSCSGQHAAFQFRYTTKNNEWGEKKGKVGLYILDLESANGTFLNGDRIEAARYVECRSGDVVKFGESERDYVILLPPK